jgi:hypothetical protein
MVFSLLETQTEIPTEHWNIVVSGVKHHNRNPNPDTTPQSFHKLLTNQCLIKNNIQNIVDNC